jgi:acyl carrier protein
MTHHASSPVVLRLMELLEQNSNGQILVPRGEAGPDSIRRTGIDSVGLLAFLVAVEDEFGIEWGDDVPTTTLNSFAAMAAYIEKELGLAA